VKEAGLLSEGGRLAPCPPCADSIWCGIAEPDEKNTAFTAMAAFAEHRQATGLLYPAKRRRRSFHIA
jgi:hypothetical protein